MYELDPYYRFVVFFILPVFIYYFLKLRNFNERVVVIILFIASIQGSLSLWGINYTIIGLFRDALIILIFIISLPNRRFAVDKNILVLLIILLFYLVTSALFWGNVDTMQIIQFLRRIFIPFVFYLALTRINIRITIFKKYIFVILCMQIFVSFYKYILIGSSEAYIGTMELLGGSLTTVIVLLGTAFSYSLYLSLKKNKYLFIIFLFTLFGAIGLKRSIVFFQPIIIIIVDYFHQKYFENLYLPIYLKKISAKLVFILIIAIISSFLIPQFNQRNEIGGGIDLSEIINNSIEYNSDINNTGFSRFTAPALVFAKLATSSSIWGGMGTATLLPNNDEKKKIEISKLDVITLKYGIGYGARTGFLWLFFQLGIIGIVLYLAPYFILFKRSLNITKFGGYKNKELNLSILMYLIVFFIDFFFYSSTFLYINFTTLSLFLFVASLFKNRKSII